MLFKMSRDGLMYALILYVFEGAKNGFDVTRWSMGTLWILAGTWVFLMLCLGCVRQSKARIASDS